MTGDASRRCSIRGSPCLRFSTLTPHQMLALSSEIQFVLSKSRSRSERFVST
jgi:hypothetical protein